MISREALAIYLDEYLRCEEFKDYAPNGIQVEGKKEVGRLCTAVSANLAVIEEAIVWGADALLVHHGYFWRGESPTITGMRYQRIAKLIKHHLTLFAYHLPLDCHLTLGNNACLGKLLEVEEMITHTLQSTPNLFWTGKFKKPITGSALKTLLNTRLKREPLHIAGTDTPILRLGWCTGSAQDFIEEAARQGVDAYISGEASERTYHQAQELGLHYFGVGHHASERGGVQALGEHLAAQFNLDYCFIDSDNPI